MTNLNQNPDQWLSELFEFEYCEECGGDACHHEAIPFMGNWFARCKHEPDQDGYPHLIVAQYHAEAL